MSVEKNKYKAREFSQESYDKNDSLAKSLFVPFLQSRGHTILMDAENYKHDIITVKDDEVFFFELEMKTGYPFKNRDSFKFDTVSFLGRKKRLHDIQPFQYIIICKETNWSISASSKDIYKPEYIEEKDINTEYRAGKDLFYRVPKQLCKFFKLKK